MAPGMGKEYKANNTLLARHRAHRRSRLDHLIGGGQVPKRPGRGPQRGPPASHSAAPCQRRRSGSDPVRRSEPDTSVHSSKGNYRQSTALERRLIQYPDLLERQLGLQHRGQVVIVLEKGVQERLGIASMASCCWGSPATTETLDRCPPPDGPGQPALLHQPL